MTCGLPLQYRLVPVETTRAVGDHLERRRTVSLASRLPAPFCIAPNSSVAGMVPICDVDSPLISPEKERRNPNVKLSPSQQRRRTTTCKSRKELQRMTRLHCKISAASVVIQETMTMEIPQWTL